MGKKFGTVTLNVIKITDDDPIIIFGLHNRDIANRHTEKSASRNVLQNKNVNFNYSISPVRTGNSPLAPRPTNVV